MNDADIERLMRRTKLKLMWQVSALYSKPLCFLMERVKEIRLSINHTTLETTMLQRFIEDNQLEITVESSRSSTDGSSETSQSTSVDTPISSTAMTLMCTTGKRPKKGELSLEHKLNIAQNYIRWLTEESIMKKRQVNAYVNDLLASIENQDLTLRTIQNEINCLLSKVGPSVCFANKKPGEIPNRERMSFEKWWTIVCANDTNRDRLIRATKLENIFLVQQIKKLVMVRKYEEQVDPAEFYRKLLENRSFPTEIDQLTNKRVRLLCRTSVAEHEAYNLRRYLEKRVAYGDQLRGRIAREKYMMGRVEQSLAISTASRNKERFINEKLVQLFSDYRVPGVPEYIMLSKQNEDLKEIVKMWQKKVAVAKLIRNTNRQKWRRLTKQ